MKLSRILILALVPLLVLSVGCKKGSKELVYDSLSGMSWVTGNVSRSGKRVMWFQLFDRIEDQEKAKKSYARKTSKVDGKYPASVSDGMVWTLINDRIEIRLIADSKNKEFRTKEKLLGFIKTFDLAGLAKIEGPKKSVDELKEFCPSLKMKSRKKRKKRWKKKKYKFKFKKVKKKKR